MNKDAQPPRRSGFSPWLVVIALLIMYIFSFIDRVIINMMVTPIERDLGISDFRMSLLLGPAFGIFYVVAGLGMGWVVDRVSYRRIIGCGITLWGLATSFCGLAASFAGLLAGRMGVGIGESTLTPAAHAVIAESFSKRRLSIALSVFTMGSVIGGGLALIIGGAVVHAIAERGGVSLPILGSVRGWQAVFITIGFVTVCLFPLIFIVPGSQNSGDRIARAGLYGDQRTYGALLKRDWRLYLLLPAAFGCSNVLIVAYLAWIPTFMQRAYGLHAGQVGLWFGIQNLIAGIVGQLSAGLLVDRLYSRGVSDAHARYHLYGLILSIPTIIAAFRAKSAVMFLVLSFPFFCLTFPFVAYAAAALQLYAPTHLRGRISALFLAIITIMGTGIGPTASGFLTDHLFGKDHVGQSLTVLTIGMTPIIVVMQLMVARTLRRMYAERTDTAV